MVECRKKGCSSIMGGAENKKEEEGQGARDWAWVEIGPV